MDQQSVIEIMSGQRSGAKARVTRGLLHAASMPYAVAMRARRRAYRAGLLGSVGVDVPVICVGNLTAGGTGKTPMVAWVIRELDAAGKTPAVLSRGYKAVDGQSDEAELLKAVCRVPVVMDPDRVAGARRAIEGGADVLVMDDGFQHRRLRRDLDIVLIDATNPFGFDHVLPRGLLREPPSALRYAGAVVVTRSDMISAEQLDALLERLAALAPGATLHTAVHRPVRLESPAGETMALSQLVGRRVLAFCGLGNPGGFFDTLAGLGADLAQTRAFEDHMHYTPELLAELAEDARRLRSEALVTTQKDGATLPETELSLPLWQLIIEMNVHQNSDGLRQAIRRAIR